MYCFIWKQNKKKTSSNNYVDPEIGILLFGILDLLAGNII